MARLTNADILSGSDADAIEFADHCGDIERRYAGYVQAAETAADAGEDMIALTYRRLIASLDRDIARFCERRGLPRVGY